MKQFVESQHSDDYSTPVFMAKIIVKYSKSVLIDVFVILVKLPSHEETNVYKARDKITLHTLESVQSYL